MARTSTFPSPAGREAAREGRGIIAELPGFRTGDALASAILTAAAPTRMAVYDRRVPHALDNLGLPLTLTPTPGRYGRYLQLLDDLLQHPRAHTDGWTARGIDTALYWTGATPHPPATTNPNAQQASDQHKPAPALRMPGTITNTTPPLSTNTQ
ncbi:hypothetical protein [Streptomyces sp. TRM70350]|uniref:hypothetical protein n=1 Tax=Streptomyces sp. TRM70350 TaxID=2856165 RepID=UPI0021105064|nr:hypothetical protein [Streptomyces sp. TRM70350]